VFVAGLGGSVALSGGASASAAPVTASSYAADVGPGFSMAVGYHFNDWLSAQGSYTWNQNRVTTTEVVGAVFFQRGQTVPEHTSGVDLLVYFRPRTSHIRPYLAVGPAWARAIGEDKPGLRVAVGIDLMTRSGWGVRYTFAETMSANPFGAALHPAATSSLMKLQNLVGIIKRF
jgi:hypothetical protein